MRRPLRSTLCLREPRAYRRMPHYVRGFTQARSPDALKSQVAQGREAPGALAQIVKNRVTAAK